MVRNSIIACLSVFCFTLLCGNCSVSDSYILSKDDTIRFSLCQSNDVQDYAETLNYGSTYEILVFSSKPVLASKIHFSFDGLDSYNFKENRINGNVRVNNHFAFYLTIVSGQSKVKIELRYDNYLSTKQYNIVSESMNSMVLYKNQEACKLGSCSCIFNNYEDYYDFTTNQIKKTEVLFDHNNFENKSLLFVSLPFWEYDYFYNFLCLYRANNDVHIQFEYVVKTFDPTFETNSSFYVFYISTPKLDVNNVSIHVFRTVFD